MERPRRTTPKKIDSTEMLGLLPEEEVALRRALLASMQPEKGTSKSPLAEPPRGPPSSHLRSQAVTRSRRSRGGRRAGRRGRPCGRARGSRGPAGIRRAMRGRPRIRCRLNIEDREPPRLRPRRGLQDEPQFSSASRFEEPAISGDESDDFPGEVSDHLDSESNFSEDFESWAVPKSEVLVYNQGGILESNLESDLSSFEENGSLDFQLMLSQSDSTTPNDVASPLDRCTRDLFGDKPESSQSKAPVQPPPVCRFRVEEQGSVPKTEDFLSFLCMRQENEEFPGLLQCFKVTKTKGVTRGSKNGRKRRCTRKQASAVKKNMVYKENDL